MSDAHERSTTLPGKSRVVGLLATLALALTACTAGGSGSSNSGGNGDNGDDDAAGTLTINTSFVIKSLDPAQVYEATGNTTVHALYDTLLTFEGSDVSTPQPLLAESYEMSDDATTFTFTLRDDAVFSDGSPVTADDVVFSLNRLRNLKGSPSVTVADLTASKVDEHTVEVTSAKPNPNVPVILTTPSTGILNSKVAEENGATAADDAAEADTATSYLDQNPAGSGPYLLTSFDPASQVVLEANPEYWGEQPAYPRVVIRNMDIQNQKLSMSRSEGDEISLDLSGKLLDDLPDNLQVSGVPDTFYFLTLNQDPQVSETTANPAFVKAVRAAIDYEGVAKLFGDDGLPAAGVVPPAFPGTLPEDEAQQQDIPAAEQLLADAGLDNPTVSFMYPSITYRGVDLGTVATKIQSDVAEAGITLELDPQPLSSFLDKQRGGKVPMRFSPQSLNYPVAASLVNNYTPGQGTAATTGWTVERADPAVMAASKQVEETLDPESQQAAMQEWQRVMNEHSPFIPFAYNSGYVVATEDLTGVEYSPAGWQVDIAAVGKN